MSDYEAEQYNKYVIGSLANMATPPVDGTDNIPVDGVVRPKEVYDQLPVGAANVNSALMSAAMDNMPSNLVSGAASVGSDLSKAIPIGAAKGAEETFDAAADIAGIPGDLYGAGMKYLGLMDQDKMVMGGSNSLKMVFDAYSNFVNDNIPGMKTLNQAATDVQYENEILGGLAEGISQFAITAIPAAKIVKGLTSTNALVRGLMWGAIADFAAFNPNDETVTVMLTEYFDGASQEERTQFGNLLVDTFKKNESNPDIVNRFKSMVDGGIIGVKAEGLIKALTITAQKVPWAKTLAATGTGGAVMQPEETEGGILSGIIKRLLPIENKLLKDAATKNGSFSNSVFNAGRNEFLKIKNNFTSSEGWLPPSLATNSKNPAFKIDDEGKIKINWQKIAWGFHKPKNKRIKPETHKNNMINTMVNDVDALVQRAQAGDKDAIAIINEASWYRTMRTRLRQEFGGLGDLFADILGATSAQTNVKENWKNSIEVLRRFTKGEYDEEIALFQKRLDAGENMNSIALHQLDKDKEDPFKLIRSATNSLFNANSPAATSALIDTFRQIKLGKAPKTINFTGNLIGYTNEATIDVWAARYLRKIAGYPRLATVSEQGVSGSHLTGSTFENPKIGAEFNFGQEVFNQAKDIINQSGVIKNFDADLGDLGADDLQAVIWFLEKENWGKKGWTNQTGGSLDFEASLAGGDQVRINQLRSIIDSTNSTPEAVEAATKELEELKVPLQRTVAGVSLQRPGAVPSNVAQAGASKEIINSVANDDSVIGVQANNTFGEFAGDPERALNVEVVAREDFNPENLTKTIVNLAKKYNQDSVFISKVVPADTEGALPGAEIYFRSKQGSDFIQQITTALREKGIDGFTFITDARQADSAAVQAGTDANTAGLVGFRFQYIPEFDELYDGTNLAQRIEEMQDLYIETVKKLSKNNDISLANMTYYDTTVYVNRSNPDTSWIKGGIDYEQITKTSGQGIDEGQGSIRSGDATQTNSGGEVRQDSAGTVSNSVSEQAENQSASSLKKKTEFLDVSDEKGINVKTDTENNLSYADLIISGEKTYETRNTNTLKSFVGKRVSIVRTGEGESKAIGTVEVGEPIEVNVEEFRRLQDQHLVPEGSEFDIKEGQTKFIYPLTNPIKFDNERGVAKGIVSRKVKGITAYHGSGKDFDQFSFEEIGTGTGETFFGYGLYFDTDKALAMNFKGKDGKVYKVDLKVADNEVIDAEIPLNEQPEKIQNALIKYYKRYNVDESRPVSDLIAKMPNNPASINYNETKLFAQNLSKNGIKALKYKQLSHPSKKKPSDTFVVFDDKVIDILTKLGIAGAVILTPEMKGTVLTNSKLDT